MDIELIQGDDKLFELTFKRNGVVQDLTGWKIFFTIKRSKTDACKDAVLHKEIIEHVDPTRGKTQISLSSQETAIVVSGIYIYTVRAEDMLGRKMTVLTGQLIVV